MYGSSNPVLRHFAADDLAAQATLQAIDERRAMGEYVPPSEEVMPRPTPPYNDYFEFDRPVPSGLPPDARDLLVEDAMRMPRYAGAPVAPVHYDSGSPTASSPAANPTSPGPSSPPPRSYDSPNEVAHQGRHSGQTSSRSGGRSEPRYYDPRTEAGRRQYGAYNSQTGSPGTSPERSSASPGASPPRRSYDDRPTVVQPPFRAGTPITGPVRRPGMTAQPGGGRRRTASTSPDGSRSASPSQPQSSDAADPRQQAARGADPRSSVRASGAEGQDARAGRGIGAKISGRPATAGAGGAGASPAGRAGRRPVSASPGASPGAGAGGGARRPAAHAPAWAPAAGIANIRLDEQDEATRVAMMLNDPGVGRELRAAQQAAAAPPGPSPARSLAPPGPAGSPNQPHGHDHANKHRTSDISEQYYGVYRLRKHREAQGVPDHRFSQPRSFGAHVPVPQKYFSFDEAHPAIATEHCLRSPGQDSVLQAERRNLQQAKMRTARTAARNRISSPTPTAHQLAADVDRLARVREAGRARLRQLEREGEALRVETSQIQQRAMDAIARSEKITVTSGLPPYRSPTASPTPPPRGRRSRSASPSAYYRGGGGGYGRGGFGPPPAPASRGHYSRSPSHSPGRPGSASPGDAYYGSPAYGGDGGYYSGESDAAGGSPRPVSAPPPLHMRSPQHPHPQPPVVAPALPVSPPPGPAEAQYILDMINQVERLPQHQQAPLADQQQHQRRQHQQSAADAAAHADHLARASAVLDARAPMGLLDGDEQRIAIGAYDRTRYEEYQRQTDLEMQRRAVEGGYDSDLDRDDAAQLLVQEPVREEEDEHSRTRQHAIEASWRKQDEWMDDYRERFGPEDGYLPSRAGSAQGSPLRGERSAMSDAEEGLIGQHYVPVVSKKLPLSAGYASEGPDGFNPHRRTARRLFFKSTIPEPFHFEEREKARPKTIAKVKLEQDLALRRAEEDAARARKFRANPLPSAVVEPRYERMMLEAEVKRQLMHQQRLEELASMIEKPFSFYYRDQEREVEREELARAAKDPRRFQVAFRARDVPTHTKQDRFRMMMLDLEARRDSTRRRVDTARAAAKERVEQEAQRRQEAASRAYQERLRSVDPAIQTSPGGLPHPTKPMGAVPDFNSMHRNFEVQMARARANIRKRITVPQEFRLNGGDPTEQNARAHKQEERRHRIILDMQVDSELLPEMRWPYKSPRGKVRPTPMPAYLVEHMARSPGNHAANVRKSSTTVAAEGGAYQTRAEKEATARKASEKMRAEALRRADRLLKDSVARKQAEAAVGGGGGGADFGLMSDVGATAAGGADQSSNGRGGAMRRRAAVAGRQDNPEVYVEARHMQIERQVREVVEDALLDQGIEAFRYVEGVGGAGGRRASGADGDGA